MKKKAKITGIEYGKKFESGPYFGPGENIGILLDSSVHKEDIQRGSVLAAVGTVQEYTEFDAVVYMLSEEECKGNQRQLFTDLNLQFYFRTVYVDGRISCAGVIEPNSHGEIHVILKQPHSLEQHMRFAICNNSSSSSSKMIGAGCITGLGTKE